MMMTAIYAMLVYLRAFLIARHRLALEAVALRQQLAVYKRRQPRPKLNGFDRLFWVVVRQIWTNWSEALLLVKPETVVLASRRIPVWSNNSNALKTQEEYDGAFG